MSDQAQASTVTEAATEVAQEATSPTERAIAAVEAIEEGKPPPEHVQEEKPKEPEPEQEEPTEEQQPQVSAAIAKIAKAEARSRRKLQAETQKLQQIQQQLAPLAELQEALGSGKSNPMQALEALGKHFGLDLSYEALTEAVLEGKLPSKTAKAELNPEVLQEIQQVKQELEQYKQQAVEKELDVKVDSYKSGILTAINSDPDEFEFLTLEAEATGMSALDLVGGYVAEVYRITGEEGNPVLLDPEDACERLEDYLSRKYGGFLEKSKKVKALIGAKTPSGAAPSAQKAAAKTLTNRHVASTKPDLGAKTDEARRARAMAAAEPFLRSHT